MFCPNCAADNLSDQNFCRTCGLKLDAIARNVAEQLPSEEHAALQRRKERFEKLGLSSLAVTGSIGLAMLIWKVAEFKAALFGPELMLWSAFAAFALFGLLAVFFFNYANLVMKFEKANPRLPSVKHEDDPVVVTTSKLIDDRPFEPVGSVTEHSTELLRTPRSRQE